MKEKNKLDMGKAQLKGQVGENAVWDGPLDTTGFPMGKGSSSGINGMQVSKYPTPYKSMPITQIAKGQNMADLLKMKVYIVNILTMAVTMTNIEVYLKILLLLVTIGYTLTKWVKIDKNK